MNNNYKLSGKKYTITQLHKLVKIELIRNKKM